MCEQLGFGIIFDSLMASNPTHTATHAGEKEGRGRALKSFLTC